MTFIGQNKDGMKVPNMGVKCKIYVRGVETFIIANFVNTDGEVSKTCH